MKQAKIKTFIFVLLFILTLLSIGYALISFTSQIPAQSATISNPSGNVSFTCNFTETNSSRGVTNITLYQNLDGLFANKSTIHTQLGGLGTGADSLVAQFNNTNRGDYTWQCIIQSDAVYNNTFTPIFNGTGNLSSLRLNATPTYIRILNVTNDVELDSSAFYVSGNTVYLNFTSLNVTNWNNSAIYVTYSQTFRNVMDNRTVYVRIPPTVLIHKPVNNLINKSAFQEINYSVSGEGYPYFCTLYTNETGGWTWTPPTSVVTVINTSNNSIYHSFEEKNNVRYGLFCSEENTANIASALTWAFSSNNTISIDYTNPVLNRFTPENNTYINQTNITFTINVTDTNIHSCSIYSNGTLKATNNSIVDGILWRENITLTAQTDYNLGFICNDTASNLVSQNNTVIHIDSVYTYVSNVTNITNTGSCTSFNVTWKTGENTNGTVVYYVSTSSDLQTTYSPYSAATSHTATIVFNNSEETSYQINISSCDIANNCNKSAITLNSPTKVCTGWNEFAWQSDTSHKIAKILNDSQTEFIYVWNQTGQSWVAYANTGAGNTLFNVTFGNVYLLYESTNSTYFRDLLGTGLGDYSYNYNITQGDNYLGITKRFNFVNLSLSLNATVGRGGINLQNFTYFSGWNNTGKRSVDYRFNWSINNETLIGNPYRIESVWLYSTMNVTWNTSAIVGNWTRN